MSGARTRVGRERTPRGMRLRSQAGERVTRRHRQEQIRDRTSGQRVRDQRTTGEQREHNRETDKRAEHAQDEAGGSGRAHSELAERTGETQVEHGGRRQAREADERTEPVQDGTSGEGGEVEDVDGSDGGERIGHKGRAGHK